jgi:hypothetical protein
VAASTDLPPATAPQVQVIEVERAFAPAAAQMMLDLIGFRNAPIEDIPTGSGRSAYEGQKLGDPIGVRAALAALPNPATWDELVERMHAVTDELPFERFGSGDPGPLRLLAQPAEKRPVLVVPEVPDLLLTCTPLARHFGALLLPDVPRSWELVRVLDPPQVMAVGAAGGEDPAVVRRFPGEAREITVEFARMVRGHHTRAVTAIQETGGAGAVDGLLLQRMQPAAYVVVAGAAAAERDAAALAANYAAVLGSPLLLLDEPRALDRESQAETGRVLAGAARGDLSRDARRVHVDQFRHDHALLPGLDEALTAIGPTYVGFVSQRLTFPIELAGDPPLGTRYAVGRLTAPDSASLAQLITAAALREEVVREPLMRAVVVEAADAVAGRYLPGARAEAEEVAAMLTRVARVAVSHVAGPDDRDRFLAGAVDSATLHFCGHGRYRPDSQAETGLEFRQGLLRPQDVPPFGWTAPIVFANACESGATGSAAQLGRAWSGLAAAFIEAGALNYVGSLWLINDSSSQELADAFYTQLVDGCSVGESPRLAKLASYERGDAIWAAVVLFGCPRNRLRSGPIDLR